MLLAHPGLATFRGLNEPGSYNAELATYTTFGNMGGTQKERMQTFFAPTGEGRAVCTVLVSANPQGFGAPFKLCGKDIALGDGGSNMARHMECHAELMPPEDAIAKGMHPVTRMYAAGGAVAGGAAADGPHADAPEKEVRV
jgi:hypothetical protein